MIEKLTNYLGAAGVAVTLILAGCSDKPESADLAATPTAVATPDAAETETSTGLVGVWVLDIDTPMGIQHPVLSVVRTGVNYSASYSGRQGQLEIEQVAVDGQRFSFPLSITVPIGTIDVTYEGEIDGDLMIGVVQNPRGGVPFSGKRSGS